MDKFDAAIDRAMRQIGESGPCIGKRGTPVLSLHDMAAPKWARYPQEWISHGRDGDFTLDENRNVVHPAILGLYYKKFGSLALQLAWVTRSSGEAQADMERERL